MIEIKSADYCASRRRLTRRGGSRFSAKRENDSDLSFIILFNNNAEYRDFPRLPARSARVGAARLERNVTLLWPLQECPEVRVPRNACTFARKREREREAIALIAVS